MKFIYFQFIMKCFIFCNFYASFIGGIFLSMTTESVSSQIAEKMALHNITPTAIPIAPNDTLKVIYPNGLVIEPGMMIENLSLVTHEPEVSWNCNKSINYTFMFHNLEGEERMCDLDSWLLVNIADCNMNKSDIIFNYVEPSPRRGINRFVFLVYEQVANVDYHSIMSDPHTRYAFRPQDFVNSHFLFDPVAGNFFIMDWPEDFIISGSYYTPQPEWMVLPSTFD